MTLRQWLKQFKEYNKASLDLEILIECPNGLLVIPVIKIQREDPYNFKSPVKALVITP